MNFEDARNSADLTQVMWRDGWSDKTAFYRKTAANSPYHGSLLDQNNKFIYDIPSADRSATDWHVGSSRAAQVNEVFQHSVPPKPPEPVHVEPVDVDKEE